jgi:2-polyprenyl-3-methyl-5-hydroxy-6-metoxy-1,4-benzoquinol methylase
MDKKDFKLIEKIRRQFDNFTYPRNPLEKSPTEDILCLYEHNIINAFYRRTKRVIQPEGKAILDAGCGSGYTTLALAQANPGARVVGIDLSEESVNLAKQRLYYHGFESVECYAISIEDLAELGQEFDYINCDEVLYLLPNPTIGLQSMKTVLKPEGIIRANLHSSLQRAHYYRAQEMFKMMGLMEEDNSQELETDIVWQTMEALKDKVVLKQQTWGSDFAKNKELSLVNHLLQGDKGYTIPDLFSALRATGLEFISMVNWRQWNLMELFKTPDDLPVFLGMSLPEISLEERLHLYELLHPVHRLLDFWCGHPDTTPQPLPVTEWTDADWQNATVYLHPQLRTPAVKESLGNHIMQLQAFEINQHLPIAQQKVSIDSTMAACVLLPLLEHPQSLATLAKRWQTLRPVHPLTLAPTTEVEASATIRSVLMGLEAYGYLLLER